MSLYHAVVWMDHQRAEVVHFDPEHVESQHLKSKSTHQHLHHKQGEVGSGRAATDAAFFHDIANALVDTREILIAGPASAKNEFRKYLGDHMPKIAQAVVGVETLDHPSEGQLVAFARRFFVGADRMRGNTPTDLG